LTSALTNGKRERKKNNAEKEGEKIQSKERGELNSGKSGESLMLHSREGRQITPLTSRGRRRRDIEGDR